MMDYHINPSYSADAEGFLEEFLGIAAERGLEEICFITHLDTDPKRDDCYVMARGKRSASSYPLEMVRTLLSNTMTHSTNGMSVAETI